MSRTLRTLFLTAACVGLAGPLAAQEPEAEAPDHVTVVGYVWDGYRDTPLSGALVRLMDQGRGALTDAQGRFVLEDVPVGRHLVSVLQYGYGERLIKKSVDAGDTDPWQVRLQPSPAALESLDVVADNVATMERRMKTRRRATAVSVRTLDQEQLLHAASSDLFELLRRRGHVRTTVCPSAMYQWCVVRRGRRMPMQVFIDEQPAFAGLDELRGYHPLDIHLVEIYSRGLQVRIYTHAFMERMARRPMALFPAMWR